jgi:hypothetical protein
MKKVERFGPEWWMLYSAAWSRRWVEAVRLHPTVVNPASGAVQIMRPDPAAVAILCKQDADDGMNAYNAMCEAT